MLFWTPKALRQSSVLHWVRGVCPGQLAGRFVLMELLGVVASMSRSKTGQLERDL